MKNESQRISLPRANRADSVAKIRPVIVMRAANGAMMDRKDPCGPLLGRKHFNARLLARLLLGNDKFPAFEVLPTLAQEEGGLKGKDNLSV